MSKNAIVLSRRQLMASGAALGAASLLPLNEKSARAAGGSFSFACDKASAFAMIPNLHKRVGYVTDLGGLGLRAPLARDLVVALPFNGSTYAPLAPTTSAAGVPARASVTGVIETLSWGGGVGDAIAINFYVSQANGMQIKAQQQSTLSTTAIQSLGYWISDYDLASAAWFEQAYPSAPTKLTGLVSNSSGSPDLNVDLTPIPVADGIDVYVYKVSLRVVPAANPQPSTLMLANTLKTPVLKPWGLVVPTLVSPVNTVPLVKPPVTGVLR